VLDEEEEESPFFNNSLDADKTSVEFEALLLFDSLS